jgi:hypothetical protein
VSAAIFIGACASFAAGIKVLAIIFLVLMLAGGGAISVIMLAVSRRRRADLPATRTQQQDDLDEKLRDLPREGQ